MDSKEKIRLNLAKIENLNVSAYEKEIIRSAYYNHINKTSIPEHAKKVLKQHDIIFVNGAIRAKNTEREERKKLYKRRDFAESATPQATGIYAKSFLQEKIQANVLLNLLAQGEKVHAETMKVLKDCEELLKICFIEGERSYNMTKQIIEKARASVDTNMQVFRSFLQPFVELFYGLNIESQQEILQKSNDFLQKIQSAKDTSVALCIKLSTIRAHNAMPKEKDFTRYLESIIAQFDNYVR